MQVNNLPSLRLFRKTLRGRLTPAEARLWTVLKASQLEGRRFRRQHSVGPYILDFYCPAEHLAVELDGAAHDNEVAHAHDSNRRFYLEELGILVLRFENKQVFQETEGVLAEIRRWFGWRGR